MVWLAISYKGPSRPAWVKEKITAQVYIEVLDEHLSKLVDEYIDYDWTFQQDGASAHRAKKTKAYLDDCGVKLIEWPSMSPDFNIIENVWGMIVRDVYRDGKQYYKKQDLWKTIKDGVQKINRNRLEPLYKSMTDRLCDCIARRGGTTKY